MPDLAVKYIIFTIILQINLNWYYFHVHVFFYFDGICNADILNSHNVSLAKARNQDDYVKKRLSEKLFERIQELEDKRAKICKDEKRIVKLKKGGQIARSSGSFCKILQKDFLVCIGLSSKI